MKDRKIRAVIIDDEQGCISNLKLHINEYCPDIDIVATGKNAREATEIINNVPFDLAFLDVRIFDNNIFDILSRCKTIGFEIIFVTAYENYALKAFKAAALDYMMKPLLPADIKACYQKIRKRFYSITEITQDQPKSKSEKKLLLKQGDHTFLIKQENIFFQSERLLY